MSNTEAMREAFEADVTKELANAGDYSRMFERDLTGKYLPYTLQKRWDSWQAATAQATAAEMERCAKVCEKITYADHCTTVYCAEAIRKGEALEAPK